MKSRVSHIEKLCSWVKVGRHSLDFLVLSVTLLLRRGDSASDTRFRSYGKRELSGGCRVADGVEAAGEGVGGGMKVSVRVMTGLGVEVV